MPIVQICLKQKRPLEKKRLLVTKVTEAICQAIEVEPKNVRIILSEIEPQDYAIGGILIADQKSE